MNKVTEVVEVSQPALKQGDLYRLFSTDGEEEGIYLLARVAPDRYQFIALCNGNRWDEPLPLSEVARLCSKIVKVTKVTLESQ